MHLPLRLILVINAAFIVVSAKDDSFTEELLLKPLYANKIYSHFRFITKWKVDTSSDGMFQNNLFPRALSEIIVRYNIQELHLSLTSGLWRYESWGYPHLNAAPGAEVWVWFLPDTADIDKNWKELSSSLSGLLCASLNFVDQTNSISPEISLRPRGIVNGPKKNNEINSTLLRYSTLPREIVCTENLTPWKKLLPCDSKAGLASLLNAGFIHNTQYHSVAIDIRPICLNKVCDQTQLELIQSVSLVHDYTILGTRNWSLRKLFGQGIMDACPLAETSTIYVETTTADSIPFELSPEPDEYVTSVISGVKSMYAKYDIKKAKPMSIAAAYIENPVVNINVPPPLHANQYKTGYGQQQGGIVIKLYNNFWTPIDVVIMPNIPWFVPIYLHTMLIKSDGVELKPSQLIYKPGKLREKAHHLEIVVRLPMRSTTSVSIDFDYVFLKWQEYPPDANHGFYIGSAVISALLPTPRNISSIPGSVSTISESFNVSSVNYLVEVRTEPMIITLPTPDFSMPYNVICLACTVVALAFGPLHNITTKRLVLKVDSKKKLLQRLKEKLTSLFKR